jgi:cation transport ATPase
LAAGVERTAAHPIAKALVQAAEAAGCRPVKVKIYSLIYEWNGEGLHYMLSQALL